MASNIIVSTDLDGTLLDHHTYSFEAAIAGLKRCAEREVPVVINTSKTYSEVVALQHAIGLDAPLIVENGSALIAAESHWLIEKEELGTQCQQREDGSRQFVFGINRKKILNFIERTRSNHNWKFEGFNDWTITQIAERTGLDLATAKQASQKEFSEPFEWHDNSEALTQFIGLAEADGLSVLQGGRFYHLQGNTDKAVPLIWLKQFAATALKNMPIGNSPLKLICLGDSNNDVAMLNAADYPVCVRSPVAKFPTVANSADIYYTQGFGPIGWSEAMLSILAQS